MECAIMRTKKTNIKDGRITRTIKFTAIQYISVDMDTKAVKEESYTLPLEYTAKEAENALREIGILVVAVTNVDTYERQYSMSISDFIKYGKKEPAE